MPPKLFHKLRADVFRYRFRVPENVCQKPVVFSDSDKTVGLMRQQTKPIRFVPRQAIE